MAAARICLLALAIAGVLVRPRGIPVWLAPGVAALVALAAGVVSPDEAVDLLSPLRAPLAFLLTAVPLAVLLDRLGFFAAVATVAGRGRHLEALLWILAAAVTTVLNLDAAVVLLTPLYVRVARRTGLDPLALAFMPVVLASLASSALPVSNLTNLIAQETWHVGAAEFLQRLGPGSLVATVVGWCCYRRVVPRREVVVTDPTPVDRRALWLGTPVVLGVLVGVTFGDALGIPAWAVALAADVVLLAMVRSVPWRSVPLGATTVAAGLALVAGAAAPHLGLRSSFAGTSALAQGRVAAIAVVGANLVNNLPMLLVGLPLVGPNPDPMGWALLAGVNFGPVLVVSGSLAGLLWLDVVRRLDLHASAGDYARLGVRIGAPAALAGLLVVLATSALV